MKGRKPFKTRLRRAFLSAVAIIGFGTGSTVIVENLDKDPKTDTQKITTVYVDNVATHGYNISPTDQFWKASIPFSSVDKQGSDFIQAAEDGDSWRIQALIDHGDIQYDTDGITAMRTAIYHGETDIVNMISDYVDITGHEKNFFIAALEGQQHDLAHQFLHTDDMTQIEKDISLFATAALGYDQIFQTLLDEGADVTARNGAILNLAVKHGNTNIVQTILNQKITETKTYFYNPHHFDAFGQHTANALLDRLNEMDAMHGHMVHDQFYPTEYIENMDDLLHNMGYVPFTFTHETVTPAVDVQMNNNEALRTAITYGHTDIAKMLINHGANVNVDNGTPLYLAVITNNADMVQTLIDAGADVSLRGESLLYFAQIIDNAEIVDILNNAKGTLNIFQSKGPQL